MTTSSPSTNHVKEVRTAAAWRRVGGAIVDLIVPLGCAVLVGIALASEQSSAATGQWNGFDRYIDMYNQNAGVLWGPLATVTLLSFLWNLLFEYKRGRTPGKALFKIQLVNEHGDRPDGSTIVLHCVLRLFSGVALFFFGHFWMLADEEKRCLYDRMTGITVITEARAE